MEGVLGDLDWLGGGAVASEGLGVELGVVRARDPVVAAGGLDLGVDGGVDATDSSSSDLTAAAPSEVHVYTVDLLVRTSEDKSCEKVLPPAIQSTL